jgi:hypothetical protein
MTNELYNKIKLSLIKYDFDKSTTLHELWHFSRQYTHGQSFKQFAKIVQNMGVSSQVSRNGEGRLVRSLIYKPEGDKYLKGEIMALSPCEACKGTGLVEIVVSVKQ